MLGATEVYVSPICKSMPRHGEGGERSRDNVAVDRNRRVGYPCFMPVFARLFAVALLATLAAGSIGHVAGATTMSVKMALADRGAMDMAECEGCGADDGASGSACDGVCVPPLVAEPVRDPVLAPRRAAANAMRAGDGPVGRTGPPELHPPRDFI